MITPRAGRLPGAVGGCGAHRPGSRAASKIPHPLGDELTELQVHLGGAVDAADLWRIAHAQGIRLPTKDYWAFRELITVSARRGRSFDAYLELFHWTELIQSSPLAVERSVYEVVGGAYRKNNITTIELRFNPMKRNRGGERDLDHIILAAIRGLDRASIEYPQVRCGLILMMDRTFAPRLGLALRHEAEVTGRGALDWVRRSERTIRDAAGLLKGSRDEVTARLGQATSRRRRTSMQPFHATSRRSAGATVSYPHGPTT